MAYNKVTLVGRLVRDPKITETKNEGKLALFTLAVDRDMPKADGKKSTDFLSIKVWDKLAAVCGEHLVKGQLVLVDGKLRDNQYEKDGKTIYATDLVADKVKFLEYRKPKKEAA